MAETVAEPATTNEPDALLLRRFTKACDEAAFAELVRRHGGLVWGVCRRRLARREDAEDAFQATFLILAAKAGSIRSPEALPGWLHRTACRAAIRVASTAPGSPPDEIPSAAGDAFAELARYEAAVAVDEELVRLPRRYRDSLVLFHLEELDRKTVADRLGLTETTVKALLARGRALLRTRLARRGVALPLVLPFLADPVPAEAATSACRLALSLTRGGVPALDLITVPSGVTAVLPWLTNKAAAVALLGAACRSIFIVTRDPVKAGPAKDAGGQGFVDNALAQADPTDTTQVTAAEATSAAPATGEPPTQTTATVGPQAEEAARRAEERKKRQAEEEALEAESRRKMQEAYENAKRGSALNEELDKGTRLEFPNTPLRDALQFIADRHDFNMIVDERGVTEAGVSVEENVDIVLQGVSLRSALNILLDPYELTYITKNDVLLITTKARAAKEVDSRTYYVRDMLPAPNAEASDLVADLSRLLPLADDANGPPLPGLEPVSAAIVPRGDRLLVTSTWAGHKRIEEVLRLLKASR